MHDTIEPTGAAQHSAAELAKDDLIDRYLNNKLAESDRDAFEIAMLEDVVLFEQVQMCDALKQGLVTNNEADISERQALAAQNTQSIPSSPGARDASGTRKRQSGNVLPFMAWVRQPLSLAASVLVAALGLNILYSSYSVPATSSMEISTVVLLEGRRGNDNAVAAYAGPGPYLFQIDAGPVRQSTSFAFSLYDADDQSVLHQQQNLPLSTDGWVRLVLDDTLSGEFVAELRWMDEAGNPASRRFPLQISN